jgi:GTP-binding protein
MEDLWPFALEILKGRDREVPPEELKEVVAEAFAVGPNWIDHLGDFRQIHQVGHRPPQFLAFVKDANSVPEALRRYLKRAMRERYGFRGHPVRWVFRHRG